MLPNDHAVLGDFYPSLVMRAASATAAAAVVGDANKLRTQNNLHMARVSGRVRHADMQYAFHEISELSKIF